MSPASIGDIGVPIIWREIDALAEHFKNYTDGPGFDVLRLVKAYQVRCEQVDEVRVERNAALSRCDEKQRELTELRHAVDHALNCGQGTVLCGDCKRSLTAARKMGQ